VEEGGAVIEVIVAVDQTLVRRGIRSLLELSGEFAVIAEASDGDEALAAVRARRPDVLLLDVRMPKNTYKIPRRGHRD
jgi:DNA-binding NarL/FixJ family response regulator